jgi:hypothetical protein
MAKHLFRSGDPKRGGRRKGTLNRATVQGREFAVKLVSDAAYVASVQTRAKAGKLSPGLEALLWYFAFGKPPESLELSGKVNGRDVSQMDTNELLKELKEHHVATAAFLASQHN